MDERAFDVVVIGAGAPGEVIAGRLGEAGLEVAIVEERLVGGECSFYACMPSKALLRPGELAAELPWLDERGVTLVRGHGRLDGERRVRVGDEALVARKAVVVATGSSATIPPVPGLAEARPWTNIEATTAKQAPLPAPENLAPPPAPAAPAVEETYSPVETRPPSAPTLVDGIVNVLVLRATRT